MSVSEEQTHASNIPKIGVLRTLLGYGDAAPERGQIFNDAVRSFRKSYKNSQGVPGSAFHDWKSTEHRQELSHMTDSFLDAQGYGEIFWPKGGFDDESTKLDYSKDVRYIKKTLKELLFRLNQQQYRNVKYKKKESNPHDVSARLGRSNTDPIDVESDSEDDSASYHPYSPSGQRGPYGKLPKMGSPKNKSSSHMNQQDNSTLVNSQDPRIRDSKRPNVKASPIRDVADMGKRVRVRELEQLRKLSEASQSLREKDVSPSIEGPEGATSHTSVAKRRKLDEFRSGLQEENQSPIENILSEFPDKRIKKIRTVRKPPVPDEPASESQVEAIRKYAYSPPQSSRVRPEVSADIREDESQGFSRDEEEGNLPPNRAHPIRTAHLSSQQSNSYRSYNPALKRPMVDSQHVATPPTTASPTATPQPSENEPHTRSQDVLGAIRSQPSSQTESPQARAHLELNFTVILSNEPNQVFEKWYPEGGKFSDKTLGQVMQEIPKSRPESEIASLIFTLCAPGSSIKLTLKSDDESGFTLMKSRFNRHMAACLAKTDKRPLLLEMEIEPVYKNDGTMDHEPLSVAGGFDW